MKTTVTLIQADVMTKNGNVYPKRILEQARKDMHERLKRHRPKIHFMNKMDLKPLGKPAAELFGIEIDKDNKLAIHIETTEGRLGKILEQMIRDGNVEYLPVIETSLNQPVIIEGKNTITKINNFRSVGVMVTPNIEKELRRQ